MRTRTCTSLRRGILGRLYRRASQGATRRLFCPGTFSVITGLSTGTSRSSEAVSGGAFVSLLGTGRSMLVAG